MSDTFGTPRGTASDSAHAAGTVHEAYSFACMNCGHGWEQSYEIAHHTDEHGHTSCVYYAGSQRVPSPLTRPSCANCGGHLVRIMRSGRVSGATWGRQSYATGPAEPGTRSALPDSAALSAAGAFLTAGGERADEAPGARDGSEEDGHPQRRTHWLADLLALFHRRSEGDDAPHDRAA